MREELSQSADMRRRKQRLPATRRLIRTVVAAIGAKGFAAADRYF
jgi:hypothetical protein